MKAEFGKSIPSKSYGSMSEISGNVLSVLPGRKISTGLHFEFAVRCIALIESFVAVICMKKYFAMSLSNFLHMYSCTTHACGIQRLQ